MHAKLPCKHALLRFDTRLVKCNTNDSKNRVKSYYPNKLSKQASAGSRQREQRSSGRCLVIVSTRRVDTPAADRARGQQLRRAVGVKDLLAPITKIIQKMG